MQNELLQSEIHETESMLGNTTVSEKSSLIQETKVASAACKKPTLSSPSGEFLCKYCKKLFPNCYKLRIHLKIHTSNKALRCTFPGCKKSYNSGKGLNLHLRRHLGFAHYKCKSCDEKFFSSRDLRFHFMRTHIYRRRIPVFKCKDCVITFKTYGQLRNHKMELSHKSKARSFFIVNKVKANIKTLPNAITPQAGMEISTPHVEENADFQQYFDFSTILLDLSNYKFSNHQFILKDLSNIGIDEVLRSFMSCSS